MITFTSIGTGSGLVNYGAVQGSGIVGGVLGALCGELSNSLNEGKVEGTSDVGGIVGVWYGHVGESTGVGIDENSVENSGTVSGDTNVGEIYGYYSAYSGCFVADTLVSTPSGLKKIQDIKTGDTVISMNIETLETEVSTVQEKFVREVANKTCTITIEGQKIVSTQGHQYYEKKKGWVAASALKVGDVLIDEEGNDVIVENVVTQQSEGVITVYNMEIEKNHNYFVGSHPVLVHNPFSCFVAGTKVSTPNGYKNIEDIQIGDIVYSMNLQTMEVEEKAVEKLKITPNAITQMYLISTGTDYIETTPDHRFYVKDKGWIDACDLETGDILINEKGNEKAITEIQTKTYDKPVTVYNFEVEDNRNYFVGEDNILVYTIPGM